MTFVKHIEVVAAIIVRNKEIFATQRGYGDFAGQWEFPGGKIEPGESPEQALQREIHEELNAAITIGDHLITVDYDYDDFSLTMQCFLCHLDSSVELLEHSDAKWLSRNTIDDVAWLPADITVVDALKNSDVI